VFGRTVRVEEHGIDSYERVLGTVRVERIDINTVLVRSSAAWGYCCYSYDPVLIEAERTARAERRGLRAAPNPIPP
jgi:endonuclease YncB( thermonuclease family)